MDPEKPQSDVGDIALSDFVNAWTSTGEMLASYIRGDRDRRVLPKTKPGEVRAELQAAPPADPEPLDAVLADFQRIIEPNTTHWNHPGFMAYFSITGSAPGILGEALAAGLNVNAMLWKTGPAATELEELVCDWLRQMLDLPAEYVGHLNDTASIASLLAIAAARETHGDTSIREQGLAGRTDLPPLTVYCSDQAHSSVDKAMITLGLGLANLRRIPSDVAFRLRVDALRDAVAADRAAGRKPIAVVATAGTTSTTSVDPLRAVGDFCRAEKLWYHIDAAYAGSAAICPEYRRLLDGLELADSIVVNPHKWLYIPIDCSVMLLREPAALKRAFSVVPEYLRTADEGVTNLMDYGPQLGRRFRALKMWFVMRAFGVRGLQSRIRYACKLANDLATWIDAHPPFERCAPTPFSTVCFRAAPAGVSPADQDALNERLLSRINADGRLFLSHTKLRDRFVLRAAIGNLRTTEAEIEALRGLLAAEI